jgi:hypothetical protein
MQYPLDIRFKIAAISSQMSVHDASGNEVFYIKQKLFKLKEKIEIYRDNSKSQLLYTIQADRVIDFSAGYTLADVNGTPIGHIKRRGAKSLWRASYDLELQGQPFAFVREANPWTKVLDALVSEIPVVGLFSGYMFHPRYDITAATGDTLLASLHKRPAFLEGYYQLTGDGLADTDEATQYNTALLSMVVVLLERMRG